MHNYQDLITLFNTCFLEEFNTTLVKGDDEPIYLPATENQPHHCIFFAHGFYASALHECSHWLIAGPSRREMVDFGYWYEPDGRTAIQQELFQSVEVKPQAIEWILSMAAGFPFRVSIDNLNGSQADTDAFKLAIYNQVKTYSEKGLPKRAATFSEAICRFYGTPIELEIEKFHIENL